MRRGASIAVGHQKDSAGQKRGPGNLEGAHGAEGMLWAEHVRTAHT
jgi:hypothetical protein